MTVFNLTPHPVVVYPPGTPDRVDTAECEPWETYEPELNPARLATIDLGTNLLRGGPAVEYVEFGHVHDLPQPEPDTWFIVSLVVALACLPGRDDLLVPYREVRNQQGTIVGCRFLARPV
jgi:hypothetical protein